MVSIVASEGQQVARSLKVLASLIKEDLAHGAKAAEAASAPFFIAAGAKLDEAKGQMPHSEFKVWVRKNFKFGERQAQMYISLHTATLSLEQRSALRLRSDMSFREAVQELTPNKNYGKKAAWRENAQENIRKAKEDASRLEEETLTRRQEREAMRKLALQLIDIGYKALASKLHPDRGGPKDAMVRLNRVRKHLQQHA